MEMKEAIAFLMGADRSEVIASLEKDAPGLYQQMFQRGHDVGYGKKNAEVTAAENKAKALVDEKAALEKKVEELSKEKPDVAKIHADYAREISTIKELSAKQLTDLNSTLAAERESVRFATIESRLVANGMDPDFAKVQLAKPDVRARIKADGSILQAGKEIPIVATGGTNVEDLFAKELVDAAPAKFRTSSSDKGSGDTTDGGAPGGANLFDKIRAEVKDEQKVMKEDAEKRTAQPGIIFA
jgi:hypothetical protein